MQTQLKALLAKANKLEDKFAKKSFDDVRTHDGQCKLLRDKEQSRLLRKKLEDALFHLETLLG